MKGICSCVSHTWEARLPLVFIQASYTNWLRLLVKIVSVIPSTFYVVLGILEGQDNDSTVEKAVNMMQSTSKALACYFCSLWILLDMYIVVSHLFFPQLINLVFVPKAYQLFFFPLFIVSNSRLKMVKPTEYCIT